MSEVEEVAWVVLWFPPEGDRKRPHRGADAEARARAFAASEEVSPWAPLLERRVTTSELVPL